MIAVDRRSGQECPPTSDIELSCDGTTAIVSPNGGYIKRFCVDGRDVLYPDQEVTTDGARKRRGGIPILFPWAGKVCGHEEMRQHGFARDLKWRQLGVSPVFARKAAILSLDEKAMGEAERGMYSHKFLLMLTVTIKDGQLSHSLGIITGPESIPTALGIHPYFNVPEGDISSIKTNIAGFNPARYEIGDVAVFSLQPVVDLEIPGLGLVKMITEGTWRRPQASLVVWTDSPNRICVEPWTTPLDGYQYESTRLRLPANRRVDFLTKIKYFPK